MKKFAVLVCGPMVDVFFGRWKEGGMLLIISAWAETGTPISGRVSVVNAFDNCNHAGAWSGTFGVDPQGGASVLYPPDPIDINRLRSKRSRPAKNSLEYTPHSAFERVLRSGRRIATCCGLFRSSNSLYTQEVAADYSPGCRAAFNRAPVVRCGS